ncbi:dipeptidase PepE [Flavobacterium difficile]|uniref:Dipeptidase PepE n=1 Tax=Flavobacterium difficile TaxID=2709659 RepID=A0ABX0I6L3_9FLAO|nr:dipeptidase PepE [Flavobacterium difficile]NHM01813.1 dipeptidase PepE [Flavobacterium difficile]
MKKVIIASTSTVFGGTYLDYLLPTLAEHFATVSNLIFIPFARPGGITHEEYTEKIKPVFQQLNINVKGIHEFENPIEAITNAEAIFTGGGNTFVLVDMLYKYNLLDAIQHAVENGVPYLGTSAGSNICGLTMGTTNDMPIVYPPSFRTLGLVSFNLNPHYLDPIEGLEHMGETRETRIKEFHHYNPQSVLGLREGSWLEVVDSKITLKGNLSARLFQQGKAPVELETGSDLSDLR